MEENHSIRELEQIAKKAELRARICRACEDLVWWSRGEAAAWIGWSIPKLDRTLRDNLDMVRVNALGGRKLIFAEDFRAFIASTSHGGEARRRE